ncbi:MAG TPA: SAM-dependent chlorinase/fluorinase [Pyrinomonadaceae bacterium]|nr:SAM-dependent chlorinase/fluorinase [Pyrinomonadaceae bacterium]
MSPDPLITLLTDFGTSDYFVGALKGVILATNPKAQILDLTHDIRPHDVEEAAFTLLAASDSFPAGTIHVAVVDPGVGSSRRPIAVFSGDQAFVGPDNGLFSYILERNDEAKVFHLTNERYFRQPVSSTFHGRDIFAPVAAALSLGIGPEKLGEEITGACRLRPLTPERMKNGRVRGRVIHIDRFGNCITNFTPADVTTNRGIRLVIRGKAIRSIRQFFADDHDRQKIFAIWGSAGFLEIAAKNTSAAKILKAKRGDRVIIT